jgi:hypothetical protein
LCGGQALRGATSAASNSILSASEVADSLLVSHDHIVMRNSEVNKSKQASYQNYNSD